MMWIDRSLRGAWIGGLVGVVAVAGLAAGGPVVRSGTDGAATAGDAVPPSERAAATRSPAVPRFAADLVAEATLGAAAEAAEAAVAALGAKAEDAASPVVLETQHGSASYYANALAGRRTASGVPYRPQTLIAAHRTLPFGTRLRVENEANGRVVEVEVVDRGPYAKGRVLDLSRRAAEELGFIRQGHTRVKIEVLEYGSR